MGKGGGVVLASGMQDAIGAGQRRRRYVGGGGGGGAYRGAGGRGSARGRIDAGVEAERVWQFDPALPASSRDCRPAVAAIFGGGPAGVEGGARGVGARGDGDRAVGCAVDGDRAGG